MYVQLINARWRSVVLSSSIINHQSSSGIVLPAPHGGFLSVPRCMFHILIFDLLALKVTNKIDSFDSNKLFKTQNEQQQTHTLQNARTVTPITHVPHNNKMASTWLRQQNRGGSRRDGQQEYRDILLQHYISVVVTDSCWNLHWTHPKELQSFRGPFPHLVLKVVSQPFRRMFPKQI
jgi:hypothetical protein